MTGKKQDTDAVNIGIRSERSLDGGVGNLSKDDYIKKLQAELEQLKAEQGRGSPSHKFLQAQSPVSKRKGA